MEKNLLIGEHLEEILSAIKANSLNRKLPGKEGIEHPEENLNSDFQQIERIKTLLTTEKFQPVRFGRGSTTAEICLAESELKVELPPSYRRFLAALGWIESPYITVFGIGADADPAYDIVRVTKTERHDTAFGLPEHLIPIVNDGSGNLYCLDFSQIGDDSECPIVFWDHESINEGGRAPLVGRDFLTWLIGEINQVGS